MQYPDSKPVQFKLILLGESGVGKTSLFSRYQAKEFPRNGHSATTVSCHCSRDFPVGARSRPVEVTLWDTANMERLHSLTDNYFREAEGAILVYDVADHMSLHAIPDWRMNCLKISPSAQLFIVGNKIDLQPRQFSMERTTVEHADLMAREFSEIEAIYRVSAKEDLKVEEMFHDIAQRMWEKYESKKLANGDTLTSEVSTIRLGQQGDDRVAPPRGKRRFQCL
ncbi:Ras-related protein Rab-21 [Holothuria leucospilota]|uniref:Ras-related protein Rab-21 n=1 Tax=Holothuria leucospilota TaxID=206669 RepID=A0A9Q1HCW0_HOLLE|nr:Ras-related protein Rab-21 [Holothuria leucospilota]